MQTKIELLEILLASSYSLMLKTQNYHWNVEGAHFKPLHELFEDQYNDLFEAVDEIAERIRILGVKAPGTYKAYSEKTLIKDGNSELGAMAMVKDLANDQEKMVLILNRLVKSAQKDEDEVTVDLAIGRLAKHQQNKWFLLSTAK